MKAILEFLGKFLAGALGVIGLGYAAIGLLSGPADSFGYALVFMAPLLILGIVIAIVPAAIFVLGTLADRKNWGYAVGVIAVVAAETSLPHILLPSLLQQFEAQFTKSVIGTTIVPEAVVMDCVNCELEEQAVVDETDLPVFEVYRDHKGDRRFYNPDAVPQVTRIERDSRPECRKRPQFYKYSMRTNWCLKREKLPLKKEQDLFSLFPSRIIVFSLGDIPHVPILTKFEGTTISVTEHDGAANKTLGSAYQGTLRVQGPPPFGMFSVADIPGTIKLDNIEVMGRALNNERMRDISNIDYDQSVGWGLEHLDDGDSDVASDAKALIIDSIKALPQEKRDELNKRLRRDQLNKSGKGAESREAILKEIRQQSILSAIAHNPTASLACQSFDPHAIDHSAVIIEGVMTSYEQLDKHYALIEFSTLKTLKGEQRPSWQLIWADVGEYPKHYDRWHAHASYDHMQGNNLKMFVAFGDGQVVSASSSDAEKAAASPVITQISCFQPFMTRTDDYNMVKDLEMKGFITQ